MTPNPSAILSELLVLQAQSGDPRAMTSLVEMWSPILTHRALRLTQDHEGTQEVLQESWVAIAKGFRSLRDPSRFGAWSCRIVHHKAADWVRERSESRSHHADLRLNARSPSDANHADPRPHDQSQAIRLAISTLDPKLRDVVYLFYLDQCTTKQISAVLDIPEGTVKTRLSSARALLKPMLERSTP